MVITKKNKSAPLAHGFVESGNLYKKVKWPFTEEFCYFNYIGKDLVNFAWLDCELLSEMLEQIWGAYMAARQKKEDYGFIASVILTRYSKFFSVNSYLSFYLMSYIDFLLDDHLDLRVLTDICDDDMDSLSEIHQDFPLETNYFAKADIISIFRCAAEAKQQQVVSTLETILVQQKDEHRSALELYYLNEQNDTAFREAWHSDFTVMLGKRAECQNEVVQLTVLQSIDDILRYELVQLLTQGIEYKICKNCGKLFIPSGRSDTLYCDRIMPGETKPCNVIGANIAAKKKVNENPALALYRQAYQRLNKRVEYDYMTQDDFATWKSQTLEKREQCVSGKLSLNDFKAWIDETSRQR